MGDLQAYHDLPRPHSRRLLDFDDAFVVYEETTPPRPVLVVRGTMPYEGMVVELAPLVYVRPPEYWGIEVVATLATAQDARPTRYEVNLDLTRSRGTRGVEVLGANGSQQIDVLLGEDKEPATTPTMIRGMVRDSGGWPVSGVTITARLVGGEDDEESRQALVDPDWSNREGRFSLRLPSSGRYRVNAEAPGYHHATSELYVEEDRRARLDFYLTFVEEPAEPAPEPVPELGDEDEVVEPVNDGDEGPDVIEEQATDAPPSSPPRTRGGSSGSARPRSPGTSSRRRRNGSGG